MDIRKFLTKKRKEENMAEGYSPSKNLKTEDDDMSEENHSHTFILKFSNSEETYTIHCDRPQTVLEAISKKMNVLQKLKCEKQNLTVQIGEGRLDTAIATHFPCLCLENGELVTLAAKNEEVEQQGTLNRTVSHSEPYCVLYIRTEGGLNSKTKSIFRSVSIKKFKELIVYGTKGMTIEDAIARDGRFKELEHFKLEDVSTAKSYVFSDDNIETHEKKAFKICLEKMTKATVNIKLEEQSTEQKSAEKGRAQDASDQTRGTENFPPRGENTVTIIRVSEEIRKRKATKNGNVEEIYERLRNQFPDLKRIMQERYPGNTFEEVLKKVDFGKAQQSFTDVCRLEKLLKLGKSVGKLVVGNAMTGTAFVLCDHYIITNAHIFKGVMNDNILDPNVEVSISFNYINNIPESSSRFIAHKMIHFDEEQDYAVLELQVSDENKTKVPPGLMKLFCPMPESGEACLIGHPAGDIQRIDPTCIIENMSRLKEVEQHLDRFKGNVITHMSVRDVLDKQGISRILFEREPLYNSVSSYKTFMYHGSSGSPVFDAHCRVFGLHSGGFVYDLHSEGFVYGLPPQVESVIEFSRPLLLIFEKFVTSLKNRNQNEILMDVIKDSKRNAFLKKILRKILGSENIEPMDIN